MKQLAAALTAVALTVTACGGGDDKASDKSPKQATSPAKPGNTLPGNLRQIGGTTQGVSLGVPKGWKNLDLSETETGTAIKSLGATGAQAQLLRQSFAQLKSLGAVYAADVKHPSPQKFSTNVNAFCGASGGMGSAADLLQKVPQQLQQAGAKAVMPEKTRVAGTDGVRTRYELQLGGMNISGTQYAFLNADRVCTVTFSTDRPKRYRSKIENMAGTIQKA